jgi:pterin-4a-carbinolamine dehydratase
MVVGRIQNTEYISSAICSEIITYLSVLRFKNYSESMVFRNRIQLSQQKKHHSCRHDHDGHPNTLYTYPTQQSTIISNKIDNKKHRERSFILRSLVDKKILLNFNRLIVVCPLVIFIDKSSLEDCYHSFIFAMAFLL